MSIHIGASVGEIMPTVLLPGDPLRAKYVAENFLEDARQFNDVRGMLGYSGTFGGEGVSVMGTGMGMPSHSIYVHELIHEFKVDRLIRIGSCGALQPDIKLRDVIIAMSASFDSSMNNTRFRGMGFAPTADFSMLKQAYDIAEATKLAVKVGGILSSDYFYDEEPDAWKLWAKYGVLAVEMETAALYTIAARAGVKALSILTVSDSLVTGESLGSKERQNSFDEMVTLALGLI